MCGNEGIMNNENNVEKEAEFGIAGLKRELKLTRICCMFSGVLTLILLVAVVMLFTKLQPIYDFINTSKPAIEKLSELDIDTFNSTMKTLSSTLGEVDWVRLSDSLDELDVEAVNELLDNFDADEFSRTLDNLNSAIETISSLHQKLSSITSVFGRN
jgi:predicted PurR-regulated permease PerM